MTNLLKGVVFAALFALSMVAGWGQDFEPQLKTATLKYKDDMPVYWTTDKLTVFSQPAATLVGGVDAAGKYFTVNSKGVQRRCSKAGLIAAIKRDKRLSEEIRAQALTYLGVPRGLKIYGESK